MSKSVATVTAQINGLDFKIDNLEEVVNVINNRVLDVLSVISKLEQNSTKCSNTSDNDICVKEAFDPGTYYSVIPYINKTDFIGSCVKFDALDYNDNSHKTILSELGDYLQKFDHSFGIDKSLINDNIDEIIQQRRDNFEYSLFSGSFEWMDARMFYYFIQKYKPSQIVIYDKSVDTTLLALNTINMFNLTTKVICINNTNSPVLKTLHSAGYIILIDQDVYDIDISLFLNLQPNDIFFIDSSHVGKVNSDVLWYLINILPKLKKGVFVQIHDIFLPNDYSVDWIKQGRFWNEQYFLYSFLQGNSNYKIKFSVSYALEKYSMELAKIQKNCYESNFGHIYTFGGGSIWLEVVQNNI
jgi:hypothetical protein